MFVTYVYAVQKREKIKNKKVWLLDAFNMLSTVYSRQLKSQVIRDLVLFEYV